MPYPVLRNGKMVNDFMKVKNLGEEKWQWHAGSQKVFIDKNQVYDIIKDLVQASATDFLDLSELGKDKKKLIGFDKKLPSFVFHLKNNKKVSFSYSVPNAQKTYIELEGRVYELFSNALIFLNWELDDFKNRNKPFQVSIDESSDFTYLSPTREVKIVKQDSTWSDGFPGNRFLRILGQLKSGTVFARCFAAAN
jgi:argonaute-like protein implicated in RNA metabolism and viral defense